MKFSKILLIASLFFSLQVAFTSCSKDEDGTTENNEPGGDTSGAKTSTFSSNESHNVGLNCMSCHTTGGPGEGLFTVAGTVYDQAGAVMPKATIKLYSEANGAGTEVASVEVDTKGNFYTTATVDFGKGLYPAVIGTSGKAKYMVSSVTSGQCNDCHTSSMPLIGE